MNLVETLIVFISVHLVFTSQSDQGNISVNVRPVRKLAHEVHSMADFKLDSDGVNGVDNVVESLSRNLLNILRQENVDLREDGVVITSHYSHKQPPLAAKDQTVALVVHKNEWDSDINRSILDLITNFHRESRQRNQ